MELTGRVGWAFLLDGGRIGIHGAEVFGAPGRNRTCDNQLRRLGLSPTELRARLIHRKRGAPAASVAARSRPSGVLIGRGERI